MKWLQRATPLTLIPGRYSASTQTSSSPFHSNNSNPDYISYCYPLLPHSRTSTGLWRRSHVEFIIPFTTYEYRVHRTNKKYPSTRSPLQYFSPDSPSHLSLGTDHGIFFAPLKLIARLVKPFNQILARQEPPSKCVSRRRCMWSGGVSSGMDRKKLKSGGLID